MVVVPCSNTRSFPKLSQSLHLCIARPSSVDFDQFPEPVSIGSSNFPAKSTYSAIICTDLSTRIRLHILTESRAFNGVKIGRSCCCVFANSMHCAARLFSFSRWQAVWWACGWMLEWIVRCTYSNSSKSSNRRVLDHGRKEKAYKETRHALIIPFPRIPSSTLTLKFCCFPSEFVLLVSSGEWTIFVKIWMKGFVGGITNLYAMFKPIFYFIWLKIGKILLLASL